MSFAGYLRLSLFVLCLLTAVKPIRAQKIDEAYNQKIKEFKLYAGIQKSRIEINKTFQ